MTAPSLRTRLLAGFLALLAVTLAAVVVLGGRAIDARVEATTLARLRAQAVAVATWIEQAGHPERLAGRLAQVTAAAVQLVDADGIVLGDSADPTRVGWPSLSPEVEVARTRGEGHTRRRLDPNSDPHYTYAHRHGDGRVVRLAVPVAELDAAQTELRRALFFAGVIALAVALLLGIAAIRAITRPLSRMTAAAGRLAAGDLGAPALPEGRDELGVLAGTLNRLAREVGERMAELTAARDQAGAVVEALAEGVIAVDADGRVVLRNRAAQRLVGDGTLPAPLATHLDAARAGADRDDEVVLDGRTLRVAARPLPAGAGAVLALDDVTQVRALDRQRRDALASAAHELRTPVTAIAGFAETLAAGGVAPAQADEFLAAISRNARRIADLVSGLLVLERLDARPHRLVERTAVPLAPIVQAVVEASKAAHPGDHTVEVIVDPGLAAWGDVAGIEQLLQNLIDNARRHGGPRVIVRGTHQGSRATLEVEDDGPGIEATHRDRVFERFYRVDRRGTGSGLGLAIAREHARAMGGDVSVESVPGRTVFRVDLDAAVS